MLANYECDLHGHTNRSDGNDTPAEYICNASARGVKILAITDHDMTPPAAVETGHGPEEIHRYAKAQGVTLIRGIEISCQTNIDDVHLVCFGCNWKDPYFSGLESFTVTSKVQSYKRLVGVLKKLGMPMSWEEVLDNDGNPVEEQFVQKKMIFELMARKGFMSDWKAAKLFVKNNQYDEIKQIKREKPDVADVIRKIHELGGIVILAHPYLINEPVHYDGKSLSREAFIQHLIDQGLDGIEACYTYDKTSYCGNLSPAEIKIQVTEKYAKKDFIISGGSDYHADAKKNVKYPREIGECGITMDEFMKYDKLRNLLDHDGDAV